MRACEGGEGWKVEDPITAGNCRFAVEIKNGSSRGILAERVSQLIPSFPPWFSLLKPKFLDPSVMDPLTKGGTQRAEPSSLEILSANYNF